MSYSTFKQRKSPRLSGYNYAQAGGYFVTICTHTMKHWFGSIYQGNLQYSLMGQIAVDCWTKIPNHYPHVQLDTFIVMPNHLHGILVLTGNSVALGAIIGAYKGAVTRQIRRECHNPPGIIWHGRYHDRIIRTEKSLERIRIYIKNNPARWNRDRFFES